MISYHTKEDHISSRCFSQAYQVSISGRKKKWISRCILLDEHSKTKSTGTIKLDLSEVHVFYPCIKTKRKVTTDWPLTGAEEVQRLSVELKEATGDDGMVSNWLKWTTGKEFNGLWQWTLWQWTLWQWTLWQWILGCLTSVGYGCSVWRIESHTKSYRLWSTFFSPAMTNSISETLCGEPKPRIENSWGGTV